MSEQKTVVVGDSVQVPGHKEMTCAECGWPVWVAPYGQQIIQEQNADVWCLSCFIKKAPITAKIMPIADELIDEIEKVLGYRPTQEELMGLIHRMLMKRYTPSNYD